MSTWRRHRCAAVVIASGWYVAAGTASGQEAGALNVDVADCVKLESPDQRLACYEARASAALKRRAAPSAEAPAPAVSGQAAESRPEPEARVVEPEAQPPEREARVVKPETQAVARRAQPPEPAPPRRARARARAEAEEARAEAPEADEIVSRVQSLRETVPNSYIITLENGQVWRQMRPQSYPLRPGQDVRIYGTRWGTASRLTADELKSFIQVERVQ
jgi:hypothetical protein